MKKLFLLDSYALIYRSYYGFIRNPRINSKYQNTSAILGFVNTLNEIIINEKPTHIAAIFDLPKPTFRHKMYPEYKAQRPKMPEDIIFAIPYIKKIIEYFNIPIIAKEGFEADDLIGAISKKAEKKGYKVFMMTPDKDYSQLVSENIFIYKPRRNNENPEIMGVPEVLKKFKIKKKEQVIDILALSGDAADNIKGAKGIGEKTAQKLIQKFGSLEEIYKKIHLLKGKQKESLLIGKKDVFLAKKLVTIITEIDVNFDEEKFRLKKYNVEKLREIFNELEFKELERRILDKPIEKGNLFFSALQNSNKKNFKSIKDVKHNYVFVKTFEDRKNLISLLKEKKEFCFDTETTGLDVYNSNLLGMAFSFEKHKAFYVELPKDRQEYTKILNEFKELFETENILKIGQNLKFDILILKNHNINVKGKFFDTMIAHYLIDSDSRHNLNFLSEKYLNYSPVPIENLIGKKGKKQKNLLFVDIEKLKEYAGEDADLTFQLKNILEKELETYNLKEIFENIEMPLINILADMEFNGVSLDLENIKIYEKKLKKEILDIEKNIYESAKEKFNINSTKQMGIILFERLKIISNPKLTKTRKYATNENELSKLKDKHKIIPQILDYRSLKKLLSTYVEALPKLVNPKTKKIHTSFNQAIVTTGRLSSSNPNLQNIPLAKDKEIRKFFVASDENHIFLSADYSQIELRLMAHLSEDENMIKTFKNGEDIHTATASKIYNVDLEKVTKEERNKAKSGNFGIIYGISATGLSRNLKISRKEAKNLIDNYFKTYPKITDFFKKNIAFARENGFVKTIFGRKRFLKDINSRNSLLKGTAERNSINTPIQGASADIIKIAMINISNKFKEKNIKSRMILQVHDELNFNVKMSELNEVKKIVKKEMQEACKLKVQLIVEMGTGRNWMEAH